MLSGIVGCSAMSATRSSISTQWRASAVAAISEASTSPVASMLPPMASACSTIWVPLRVGVPRTTMSCTRFEMPAFSGVSQRVPILTISEIATTGAVGFSRTSTVRPLASRVRVTDGPWAQAGATTSATRSAPTRGRNRLIGKASA